MVRHAHGHRVQTGGDTRGHRPRPNRQHKRQWSRPEGRHQRFRRFIHFRDQSIQLVTMRDMHNQWIVGRSAFGDKYSLHGCRATRIRTQAVDRFGRKGHRLTLTKTGCGSLQVGERPLMGAPLFQILQFNITQSMIILIA
ncbi:hypothetical protein D3C74_329180 [compost metagenome]